MELPKAGMGNLQWATWEYLQRWVPEVVHITSFGWDSVHIYLSDWVEICDGEDPLPGYPYLGHFLFLSGLVLRDIREVYFSLNDPDDAEPAYLPQYIVSTQLGLPFVQRIETIVKSIWAQYSASPPVQSLATAPKLLYNVIDPSLDISNSTTRLVEQERTHTEGAKTKPTQKHPNPSESSPVPAKKARKCKVIGCHSWNILQTLIEIIITIGKGCTCQEALCHGCSERNLRQEVKYGCPRKTDSSQKPAGSANKRTDIAGPSRSSTAGDEDETHGRHSHRLQGKDRRVWNRDGTSTVA